MGITDTQKDHPETRQNKSGQYVTFTVKDELYGIDVKRAQEVMNLPTITKIPNTMPFMKGVIDLRGKVIPLIDMRIKFGIEEKTYDQNTVIIIIDVKYILCGLIVDSVSDVSTIAFEDVQYTPHFASEIDKDAVYGIGRIDQRLVIILDVDKLLTERELLQIKCD